MDQVIYINCFEVPAGREDDFIALWREVNAYMTRKPGYLSHRLHRSLAPDGKFRFINIPVWETVEQFNAAHDDGFRQLISQPGWADFSHTGTLCEVIHEGSRETAAVVA